MKISKINEELDNITLNNLRQELKDLFLDYKNKKEKLEEQTSKNSMAGFMVSQGKMSIRNKDAELDSRRNRITYLRKQLKEARKNYNNKRKELLSFTKNMKLIGNLFIDGDHIKQVFDEYIKPYIEKGYTYSINLKIEDGICTISCLNIKNLNKTSTVSDLPNPKEFTDKLNAQFINTSTYKDELGFYHNIKFKI